MDLSDGTKVRIVEAYKHLGTNSVPGGLMGRKFASRASASDQSTAGLHKVIANPRYPEEARAQVAEACSLTRLFFAAATWQKKQNRRQTDFIHP